MNRDVVQREGLGHVGSTLGTRSEVQPAAP
jgi:hypothetical protein